MERARQHVAHQRREIKHPCIRPRSPIPLRLRSLQAQPALWGSLTLVISVCLLHMMRPLPSPAWLNRYSPGINLVSSTTYTGPFYRFPTPLATQLTGTFTVSFQSSTGAILASGTVLLTSGAAWRQGAFKITASSTPANIDSKVVGVRSGPTVAEQTISRRRSRAGPIGCGWISRMCVPCRVCAA